MKGSDKDLVDTTRRQVDRKLRARKSGRRSVWTGLGMFGLIGWSIALPTILGVVLGSWIDQYDAGPVTWTLALLIAGLCLGCLNAWMWLSREGRGDE